MVRHNELDRRDGGHAMRRVSRRAYADRLAPHWAVLVLGGGVVAVLLLVATVTDGRAGGLFDWLFTGKEAQRSKASPSQKNAPLATVRLRVEGMVCYGWPPNVKRALERLDGVVHAEVSFEEKAATVQYDPNRVMPDQMIAAINAIGFHASPWEAPAGQRFQGQGTIVTVDQEKGTVTLDHGEIKGLMPPMVMEFVVHAREALQGLKPGDSVRFILRPKGLTVAIADLTVIKE